MKVCKHIIVLAASLMLFLISFDALAQRPHSVQENMILSAVKKYNEGNYDAANESLKHIIQVDSENDAAWYYLALTSRALKDVEMAETCLQRAVELDPDNFWYRYGLAEIYKITNRLELTIDIYEKLLQDFPKKSDLYIDLATYYFVQDEFDKALTMLDEVETVFGVSESVTVYRFNILRRMGRVEDAYASLQKYNEEYSSPYILSTLADYEMSMYNDSTALVYYNEALDLAPDYAPALLGKAETLRMNRMYDEYFETLDQLIVSPDATVEGKNDYMMAIIQRLDTKFLRTFRPKLDSAVTKLATVHPLDSMTLQTAGIYFYTTSRNEQAKKYFKKGTDLYPTSLSANASLVEFLMYTQMWEDLSVEGRKAFERFPKETSFLEMAGVGDYNLGNYEKVLEACETILEVAPKDSSTTLRTWSTVGDLYHQLGDPAKSYKAYEKALKINPDYVYVLNNYAYYLSVEGKKLKKALAMSKKTIQAEPNNATYLDTYAWILYLLDKPAEAKPYFKQAMLNGGKDSPVILDHYAEVLFALKEYDLAFVYWNLAKQKNNGQIPDLDEKISRRKEETGR